MTVTLIEHMGTDLTVVNSARVSFQKIASTVEAREVKLINYLAKHNHWTPFSHCMVTLHIKMPIFVSRQWFKHSVGFTRNEVSRRYVKSTPEFWIPEQFRSKPVNAKQGSGGAIEESSTTHSYRSAIKHCNGELVHLYEDMINDGVAPEIARSILPQSMYTEFYETASLAAYARLYKLRGEESAQKEIQDYAEQINSIMAELFPVSWAALVKV